jgi:LCP family protein required for cell wall assembly
LWRKLNSAYAIGIHRDNIPNVRDQWKTPTGGGDLAVATVEEVTGLHIDYWVGVDFKAFSDVVNALGGIDLTVPAALDDPFFPLGETTGYMRIRFNAGPQHLDGERALQYARSRETTSDFDRSRRQQLIMLSVRQRVLTLNAVPKLFSLLGALQNNVRTNLRPAEMRQLADLASQFKEGDIRRVGIDDKNFLRSAFNEGGYVLLPRDPSNATLQRYLAQALPDQTVLQAHVPIRIQDGTTRYWLFPPQTPAAVLTELLADLGWQTSLGPPATAQRLVQTQILDRTGGAAPATLAWLQSFFNATVVPIAPSDGAPPITVVLVSDFTTRAFAAPPAPAPPAPAPPAAPRTGTPPSPSPRH